MILTQNNAPTFVFFSCILFVNIIILKRHCYETWSNQVTYLPTIYIFSMFFLLVICYFSQLLNSQAYLKTLFGEEGGGTRIGMQRKKKLCLGLGVWMFWFKTKQAYSFGCLVNRTLWWESLLRASQFYHKPGSRVRENQWVSRSHLESMPQWPKDGIRFPALPNSKTL